jgi:hypothetical protein
MTPSDRLDVSHAGAAGRRGWDQWKPDALRMAAIPAGQAFSLFAFRQKSPPRHRLAH